MLNKAAGKPATHVPRDVQIARTTNIWSFPKWSLEPTVVKSLTSAQTSVQGNLRATQLKLRHKMTLCCQVKLRMHLPKLHLKAQSLVRRGASQILTPRWVAYFGSYFCLLCFLLDPSWATGSSVQTRCRGCANGSKVPHGRWFHGVAVSWGQIGSVFASTQKHTVFFTRHFNKEWSDLPICWRGAGLAKKCFFLQTVSVSNELLVQTPWESLGWLRSLSGMLCLNQNLSRNLVALDNTLTLYH